MTILCISVHASHMMMQQEARVVSRRLTAGYGLEGSRVIVDGNCLRIISPTNHLTKGMLQVLAAPGQMVLGSSAATVAPGAAVRLIGENHSTGANSGQTIRVIVPATDILAGSFQVRQGRMHYIDLLFHLSSRGKAALCRYTAAHLGQYAPLILDGHVLSDPEIVEPICEGAINVAIPPNTRITVPGGLRGLKIVLKYGHLPERLYLRGGSL